MQDEGVIKTKRFNVDIDLRQIGVGEAVQNLTPQEFRLIRFLALNAGRIVTKEVLVKSVLVFPSTVKKNTVEAYVSYLRKKLWRLGVDPSDGIQTRSGFGYMVEKASE